MNADRVINKINHDMNAFNESGGREDKTCAEGLRIARTYIQQEVLKRKILTHDQQVVLEWLKQYREEQGENPLNTVSTLIDMYCADPAGGEVPLPSNVKEAYKKLNDEQEFQVLAAFADYGLEDNQ